jgi:hypothetical protein
MTVLLTILAVTFAAFCVWLTVRIVNRRERWAKWTLACLLIGTPAMYLGSFGPVIRHATSIRAYPDEADIAFDFYDPIFWACGKTGSMPALWEYLNFWGCGFEPATTGCVID